MLASPNKAPHLGANLLSSNTGYVRAPCARLPHIPSAEMLPTRLFPPGARLGPTAELASPLDTLSPGDAWASSPARQRFAPPGRTVLPAQSPQCTGQCS